MVKNMRFYNYLLLIICSILIILKYIIHFNTPIFYKNIKKIKNPNDILVLVNKNNKLDYDFVPDNLELISTMYANEEKYLQKPARIAFENLSKDAKMEGYSIIAVSTYRSYEYQVQLYNYYVDTKGLKYADLCSARPGHSEHQTGLAVDVMGSNLDYDHFEESIEFNWMRENAHKYGFIMRYKKGSELITGFKYEPWHYRYVGLEAAKYIYENDLTLEEYYKALK